MENNHQMMGLNASLHRLSPEASRYSFLRAPGVGYLKWVHELLFRSSDIKSQVAQHEGWWTEAPYGQKYKISVSREYHASSTSGDKQRMGSISVLCCVQLVYPQQILF